MRYFEPDALMPAMTFAGTVYDDVTVSLVLLCVDCVSIMTYCESLYSEILTVLPVTFAVEIQKMVALLSIDNRDELEGDEIKKLLLLVAPGCGFTRLFEQLTKNTNDAQSVVIRRRSFLIFFIPRTFRENE